MSHANDKATIGVRATGDKRVIMQFDREHHWLGFTPAQAVELAYTLYEKAKEADPPVASNIILLPPGR